MALSAILIVIVLVAIAALGYKRRPKNFPPGPARLPYVGNLFQLGMDGYKRTMKMSEKYGDILGLSMGMNWMIVMNNPEDVRELFGRPEFSGRSGFNGFTDTLIEDHNYGIILSSGRTWIEHRRFSLRTLRDFGLGRRSMESIIMEEVREIISQLKERYCDHPISTNLLFNPAVLNVIWSIVAGQRYSYDDPKLTELHTLLNDFFGNAQTPRRIMLALFPGLIKIREKFPFLIPLKDGDQMREKFYDYFRRAIREHEATLSEDCPRDYIDAYLMERKSTTDPSSSFYPNAADAEKHFITSLMDLFLAGSETTSTTLRWACFLLAHFPESQNKLATEIHSVVGNREVLLQDKLSLPYVEATIMEILRFSSLVGFGVPHSATQDVTYKGYRFPKGTTIFGNMYAAHYSPSCWGDPENFRPERFLSADEKSVIRTNKAWMAFGTGKRQCMGESLARDEVFLFLANLFHNFEVTLPLDEPKHSMEGIFNFGIVIPEPHNVILRHRKKN